MVQGKFLVKPVLIATVGVFFALNLAQAAEDLLTQAAQLLNSGKAKEAYALLAPQEPKRAGEPDYDYLLGLAALDSGQPGKAVFALERVLAVNPDHPQARAEIARAYFMLGEDDSAKQEFENVKKQNPPPQVNETIQKYLTAIDQRFGGNRTKVQGYVEVGYGYDSNANSATAASDIAIPLFGGLVFTLDDTGRAISDNFYHYAGGVNLTYPVSPAMTLFTGLDAKQRSYREHNEFDIGQLDANLGLRYLQGRNQFILALQGQELTLDSNKYRNSIGVNGQWQHTLDARNLVTLYGQYAQLSYPDQEVRDANQIVAGLGYGHAFGAQGAPVIFLSAFTGDENPKSDMPQLAYKFYGVRIGGQYNFSQDFNIFAALGSQWSNYDGQDTIFQVTRKDIRYDVSIGAEYIFAKNWRVKPQVIYTHNDSNIVIDEFKRTETFVTVRYDFRLL